MEEPPRSGTPDGGGRRCPSVRLLGDGVVEDDGHVIAALTSPRVLRLLARLAAAPSGRLDRRRLAFDLWPDSTEPQALTNLRKVLHELRGATGAGGLLSVDHTAVSFGTEAANHVDVLQLRRAIDAGDGENVARVYRGDLLPSCYDDWLLDERDRLREAAWTAIEAAARAVSDADARLTLAQALLSIDPLRETGYQLAMRAHAALGQRAQALRVYHRCVQVLEHELDVEPNDATLAVYDEILASTHVVTQARPSRSGPVMATMVGRDAEMALVDAAWHDAIAGAAQVVLVIGEAGIGKSRLVAEVGRRVGCSGVPVAVTRAYEAAGGLPWGPVTEWLRSDALAGRVVRLEAPWREELSRLLPELRKEGGPSDTVARVDPSGRRVLFDALVRVFADADRPLLLVLDDLQWCDEDTVEFLGYLVSRAPATPILIAATARPDELAANERVQSSLGAIARDACLTQIPLGRLDAASTARISAEICARTIASADAQRLWVETEGIPLFTVELARAGWSGQPTATAMPPTMRSVIASRLQKLTATAREIAEVASTVGRAFTTEIIAEATGVDPDDLVEGLDELWRKQIIREHGDGYDFTHDKLREVLHVSIAPARGRQLHRQVAAALTAMHADDLGPVSRLIAAQLSAAGQSAEAIDAYRRAADFALGLFSLDEAIDCLHRALRSVGDLAAGPERADTELQLWQALVAPVAWSAGYGADELLHACERVVALCRRTARPVDPAARWGLGVVYLTRCDFGRSASLAGELLAEAAGNPVALVEGHYLMGVTQFWRGELASSREHLDAALGLYSREQRAEFIARFVQDPMAICLLRLGQTRLWQGHPAEARELLDRARIHGDHVGHPGTMIYVASFSEMTALELADLDLAERCAAELDRLFDRFGGLGLGWFEVLRSLLSECVSLARGDASGLGRLAAVLDNWRSATQNLHFSYGLLALGRGHARLGDVDTGRRAIAEALEWADAHDQHYLDAPLWLADADLLHRAGDRIAARTARRRALRVAREQGAGWYEEQAIAALRS